MVFLCSNVKFFTTKDDCVVRKQKGRMFAKEIITKTKHNVKSKKERYKRG